MDINRPQIAKILKSEQGYTENQINLLLNDIDPLHNDLEDVLAKWLEDRSILGGEIAGLTLMHLRQNEERNFIPALGILNHLLADEGINQEMREKIIDVLRTSKNITYEADK